MSLPAFLDREFASIPDLLRRHAAGRAQSAALIDGDGVTTWSEFDSLVDRFAAAMQQDGVRTGGAIAIVSANRRDYVAAYFAGLRCAAAVAPLQTGIAPDVLERMIADSGASLVLTDAAAEADYGAVIAGGNAVHRSLEPDRLRAWLAPAGAKPAPVDIRPEMPFNIIYSSGTTGVPKGIVQPHRMRWAHVKRGAVMGYSEDAVTLVSTPLYSNTTLVSLFPTVAFGGTVVLMAKFDAGRFLELAERHRVTHAMLVPVQYQRVLAHPDFDRRDLSSFRHKYSTGAPFPAGLKAETLRRWPGELRELYGMTEGGASCLLDARLFPQKLHTVGRPNPGSEFLVIGEDGQVLPEGSTGELVGRSGAMMLRYHNQPGKTAEFEWSGPGGKRYFRTGDIGRFDEDGFLVLIDRRKDMIISGGFNIYPSDLEETLRGHEAVLDAAVAGVPSERWGETPVAWVVLRAGGNASAAALLEWANARLGKTQRLADLRLVDELPRNPAGKTLKRELRDRYIQQPRAESA